MFKCGKKSGKGFQVVKLHHQILNQCKRNFSQFHRCWNMCGVCVAPDMLSLDVCFACPH